ncbi:MAG: aldo/keto reductase [Deltaproteobacteria bacterium]|nr:aldo/keto reductase [Deltaproteobacteria bacterium]
MIEDKAFEPSDLFLSSSAERLRAVRECPRDASHAAALRAVLLFDSAVVVRVAAAEALAVTTQRDIAHAVIDAFVDPSPLVREAAVKAAARQSLELARDRLVELARQDEAWRVRRAAVFALAAVSGFANIDALRDALEDPFWRVRHAAVLSLEILGFASEDVRARVSAAATETPAAERAKWFLSASWDGKRNALEIQRDHESYDNNRWYDDDPAVMTARVTADPPPAQELVALLGESHETLRRAAIRALATSGDRIALAGAACWLEAGRVPHAAASARETLLRAKDDGIEVAIAAISSNLPNVAAWAIETAAIAHRAECVQAIVARSGDPSAEVRAAVADGVVALVRDDRSAISLLKTLSEDTVSHVRDRAIAALMQCDESLRGAVLDALSLSDQSTASRVVMLHEAASRGAFERVQQGLEDTHPYVLGTAVELLRAAGRLDKTSRLAYLAHRDPWVRGAAVEDTDALSILRDESDPIVRRIAMDRALLAMASSAPDVIAPIALLASQDADPWIRARATRMLNPADDGALVALLRLSAERDALVRAWAAETLEACGDLNSRIVSVFADVSKSSRQTALAWLARTVLDPTELFAQLGATDSEQQLIAATLAETPRAKITARVGELQAPAERVQARATRTFSDSLHRPFGETGLSLAPIAFSGARQPVASVFSRGRDAGMNAFFWEPSHHTLTKFIRGAHRKSELVVSTGSYHADAKSIERDVDLALRRLGVDRLGVFLLFWARSDARLDQSAFETLERLKERGKIAAHGFSTHLRDLAERAVARNRWDVVMTRFNAAHVGAERSLFPTLTQRKTAAIAFTSLCYTRLLRPVRGAATSPISAADCYRFSLSDPAVGLVLAAPSRAQDADAALQALKNPALSPDQLQAIRAHGREVYRVDSEFNTLVRKGDRLVLADPREVALGWLDHDGLSAEA